MRAANEAIRWSETNLQQRPRCRVYPRQPSVLCRSPELPHSERDVAVDVDLSQSGRCPRRARLLP